MDEAGGIQRFAKKVLIASAVVICSLLLLTALYYTFNVILLIFAAALLAIFLRGMAEVLANYVKLSDGWLVLLVSLLLVLFIAGFIAALSPSITEQAGVLREKLPASLQSVTEFLSRYSWGRALIQNLPSYNSMLENLNASNIMSGVGGVFSSTMGILGNIAIVVLLAVYLATEPKLYLSGFLRLFPFSQRDRVRAVITGGT